MFYIRNKTISKAVRTERLGYARTYRKDVTRKYRETNSMKRI